MATSDSAIQAQWLDDLKTALSLDEEATWRAFTAVAHALSRSLAAETVELLTATMPPQLKACFSLGGGEASFEGLVQEELGTPSVDSGAVCRAVLFVIALRLPIGKLTELEAKLPQNVRSFWPLMPRPPE